MRFDVIIIGGGLAGLAAGLRLQGEGLSCALINAGQSALHFSSGALDLLNFMPDGSPVENPGAVLRELVTLEPEHPYALLGAERVMELAVRSEELLAQWGVSMNGSVAGGNHYRITPLGELHPTWLSAPEVLEAGREKRLPWKKVLLVNIEGFLDFTPEILAENLAVMGVASEILYFATPELEHLRKNPSEFRSINIARVLDLPQNLETFASRLAHVAGDCEAVLLPACLGSKGPASIETVSRVAGRPVKVVPTLPPSVLGARLGDLLTTRFTSLGGVYMPGDRAVGYSQATGRITEIVTVNHEDIALEADNFILATGGFFSQGLRSNPHGVHEPIFNLDLLEVPEDRGLWTAPDVFGPQPYSRFGVRSDAFMRTFMEGRLVPNLYAAGMVLGGYNAVRLGCGGGVALTTALAAAESILQGRAGP